MRAFGDWITAPLLAFALCLLAAGPASAADSRDGVVASVEQSDSSGLVRTAQSEGGTDTEPGPDRRLVERESGERVDAVVIALWTIAGVMTVLLGIFLWHTSPRRRLRLAGTPAELFDDLPDEAGGDSVLDGRSGSDGRSVLDGEESADEPGDGFSSAHRRGLMDWARLLRSVAMRLRGRADRR